MISVRSTPWAVTALLLTLLLGAGVLAPVATATPVTAAPTPAVSGPMWIDPALADGLTAAPRTIAIVRLDAEFTGDDSDRSAAAASATAAFLASLPTRSYSDVREPGTLPVVILDVDAAALAALRTSRLVRSVSADTPMEIASDQARTQDGSKASNAAGWKGDGSTVAVIDTGVQSDNPYLKKGSTAKVVGEACFTTPIPAASFTSPCPGGVPMSTTQASVPGSGAPCLSVDTAHYCAHGTHVAGIIAGEPGVAGYGGVSGAAPNAKLVSIQVFGERVVGGVSSVQAQPSDVIRGLQWIYNRRADYPGLTAVNVSLASTNYANRSDNCDVRESAFKAAIDQLRAVGIATIVAAGNSGWNDGLGTPACISTAISVGAMDDLTLTRMPESNMSTALDLFAPGVGIVSSWPTSMATTPMIGSGSSQAAPAVAGAWALLRQRFPGISATDALAKLRSTGTTITTVTPSATFSVPTINVAKALETTRVTAVAAGDDFSCARRSDSSVSCAGNGTVGQLGNGKFNSNTNPVRVNGINNATAITAGVQFSCARISANLGSVKCWGHNGSGQLGVGNTTDASTAATVSTDGISPLSSVSSVDAGGSSVCAVINTGVSGTAMCWGDNYFRQLGDGTRTNRTRPTPVRADATTVLTGVKSIAVGALSTCALMSNSTVVCWGHNAYGELGNNTTTASAYPVPVRGITNAKAVRVGNGFACALLTTGQAKCWGLGGTLGNGTLLGSSVPVTLLTTGNLPLTGITEVQTGESRSCAIVISGTTRTVLCWGTSTASPLPGSSIAAPVTGTLTSGATAVSVGTGQAMVVIPGVIPTTRAAVWGANGSGQLGIGNTTFQAAPKLALRF